MKRKTITVVLSLLLVLVFAFTASACSSGDANVISLDKTELNLFVGEEYTLTATTDPEDAVNKLTWSSDDTAVATVTNGTVKAVKSGSTTVWAKAANGVKACCNIRVTDEWLTAFENTAKQTDYTVTMTEKLGVYDAAAAGNDSLFGLDIAHTAKYNKTSNLYSKTSAVAMSQSGESMGEATEKVYFELDGNTIYSYKLSLPNMEWTESGTTFNDSGSAENYLTSVAMSDACELFFHMYKTPNGESGSFVDLADYTTYDASAKKLTISGVTTQWSYLSPECNHITKWFNAVLEVTFENDLLKSYKLVLDGTLNYSELFENDNSWYSLQPAARDGEPEQVRLKGEITGNVVYGNTQVAIASGDQPHISKLKVVRPLKNAFNIIHGSDFNFTMTERSGPKLINTAKYSITAEGGVYSSVNTDISESEYAVLVGNNGSFKATQYYNEYGMWLKREESNYSLYNTAAEDCISKYFFVGDREDPENGYRQSVRSRYSEFTKGEGNTYTATFYDYYREWNSDEQKDDYIFASCEVTVNLDELGRLVLVNYDYGSDADGKNFINSRYEFTAYGTTHATVPTSVSDVAKEIMPEEDSEIYQAFDKLDKNTQSVNIVTSHEYSADTDRNSTKTTTIDATNFIQKNVYSYNDGGYTEYYKMAEDNGAYYRYYYNYNDGIWIYNKYEANESELEYFTHVSLSSWNYCAAQSGTGESIQQLYWMFEKSGDEYVAHLYHVTSDGNSQTRVYTPATVTIKLDGNGRITSLKIEKTGEVEEYTLNYDSVTVTLPTEVESAKEYISREQSQVYNALNNLINNTGYATVEYSFTDNNDSTANKTGTDKIDVSSEKRETIDGDYSSYKRIVTDGDYYVYTYYRQSDDWYCNAWQYSDHDEAVQALASIQLEMVSGYSNKQDGDNYSLSDLYLWFDETADGYVTDKLYFITYLDDDGTQTQVYIPATVTIQIDGQDRIVSIKVEIAGSGVDWVYEYTINYDPVSVTIPDQVLNVQP